MFTDKSPEGVARHPTRVNHTSAIYLSDIARARQLPFPAITYILSNTYEPHVPKLQVQRRTRARLSARPLPRQGEFWRGVDGLRPGNKKVAPKIIDLRGREGLQESKAIERIKDINHAHLVSIFAYWVIDAEGRVLDDQSIAQLALGSSEVKDAKPASATMFVNLDERGRWN